MENDQTENIEQAMWSIPTSSTNTDLDMDDESRKLIEQMLAEEEFYYGRDTISTLKKQSTTKKKRKPPTKDTDYEFDHNTSESTTTLTKKSRKEGSLKSKDAKINIYIKF